MASLPRVALPGVFLVFITAAASAQVTEIEPNDNKASATPAPGLVGGNYLDGNSQLGGGTGNDYWLVSTAIAAPGIYRHELVISTTGTAGHTGFLRGLNEFGGAAGSCPLNGTAPSIGTVDTLVQTSSTASLPARMNAWYGFGKGEQIYYMISGAATTTANYHVTLNDIPVSPLVCPVSFTAGPVTLSTTGLTIADTDIYLYDANFDVVLSPEGAASNDDEHCHAGNVTQSWLTRTLGPGTYYLAVGGYNTCTNLASPSDDDYMGGVVLDFPGALACNVQGTGADRDFRISDGVTTYTSNFVATARYFDVIWMRFTVLAGPPARICNPGSGGVSACPCSNPPAGIDRGCDNSFGTGGASIAASGNALLSADTLVFSTSNQTSNGTTILLQGTANNPTGVAFGQGVRCVAGTLKRLYVKSPGGTGGITAPAGADPSVSTRSASAGDPIGAGQHRFYMAYYRDPGVLGGCAASATFNGTNALDVTWY